MEMPWMQYYFQKKTLMLNHVDICVTRNPSNPIERFDDDGKIMYRVRNCRCLVGKPAKFAAYNTTGLALSHNSRHHLIHTSVAYPNSIQTQITTFVRLFNNRNNQAVLFY